MRPPLHLRAFLPLILAAGGATAYAQVQRPGPMPGGGVIRPLPKKNGPVDKAARRIAEVERFERMSPEQRQRALDKLPPERRARIEQGMRTYENMDPQNRERLANFQSLPKEQRQAIRDNFRRMQELPPPRRGMVRREIQELRKLSPEDRETRMQSGAFKRRFGSGEQSLIRDTITNLPDQD